MNPTNTREAIVEAARLLVQDASYYGLTFRDVSERVGIRKASIYHHFETKEALAVAMLDRAAEDFGNWARRFEHEPPMVRLQAYCFDFYRDRLQAGDKLCPGGAFTAAWPHLGDAVRMAVNRLFDAQHRFVKQALIAAQAGDATGESQDPEEIATWVIASVQGAIVTARARGNASLFERLCRRSLQQLHLAD
ncbi:TetR/AcrR family transcriptional regulator [Algiphilus sp.]|uniref:TetR/AcrR family transcriptional regulator n=1 Tax=Algiphilus sp. TaxID=1872431 RepID=UPI0025B9FA98|nr:TetR/AcrR family transcriptional regulator [Algiphilus sp.]MCK5768845.1 TetR/AcrR family transcriptional regulator [Algiphilus sp.]